MVAAVVGVGDRAKCVIEWVKRVGAYIGDNNNHSVVIIYPLVTIHALAEHNKIGGFTGSVNRKKRKLHKTMQLFIYGLVQYYHNTSNESKHRRPHNAIIISRRV